MTIRKVHVPEKMLNEWNEITNLVASLCKIPSCLVMRQNVDTMEVMSGSEHPDSPYKLHETAPLKGELYCETVINTQRPLNIPNALKDPEWDHNPDIKLGMIFYYGVPVNWSDGTPFGTFCILSKEEKHTSKQEEDLVQKFAHIIELTLKLLESEGSLQDALDKLRKSTEGMIQSEKMATIGTFAGGIAHELNNPLMGILNYIQYCKKNIDADQKDYNLLDSAEKETLKCAKIIQDLVSFYQTKDESTEKPVKINLAKIVERVYSLLLHTIKKYKVKFIINFPEDGVFINGNENKIQQAFLYLLLNALDAVKDAQKKEIIIKGKQENNLSTITIFDSGLGIEKDILTKIYDPFFTTKKDAKQVGLGLSIAKQIIEENSGKLSCESTPNEATVFTITIPIQ